MEQLTSQHPVQQQSTQDATSTCVKQLTAPRPIQQQLTQDATSQHPVQQQSTQDATSTCVKQLTAPRPVQQQLTQDATSTHVEQVTAPHLVQHQSTQDATSTRQVPCPVQQQSTQVATSKDDEQVTSPCPVQHQSLQQFHQTTTPTTTSNSKHNISISSSSGSLFSRLNSLASERGFSVKYVPGDGSCLFHSVRMQLETLGIHLQARAMREQLAQYLQEHPYTHDGSCHLRVFLSDSVASTGDMESAEEEDHFISSIADDDTRQQLRWCRYLSRLNSTAWGDHIAVQGLADMLHVDIHIIATSNPDMEPIKSCHPAIGVLNLGLMGQLHYISLHRGTTSVSDQGNLRHQQAHTEQQPQSQPMYVQARPPQQCSVATEEQEEREQAEDEEAFHHHLQLRGLPYDTVMHREDTNLSADSVFFVAPGEGQRPIPILTDEGFEVMCNPTKYPTGKFGLMAHREKKLTVRKYFNQRLLDADGRFCEDVEYLLTAQYAVESKQVADDASIMLRQSKGRLYRGQVLTAGVIQDQSVLLQMIQRDDAYKFLKNVRGSPAYFQRVQYEVLAMIRQLGIPTFFLTLSAADMQWPDVIQTIARQYGVTFTDEAVAALSFEEKSKWLRQNPVTAARHFQYRLNTFFNGFLKSKAHPLGELSDSAIRIEFQMRGSPHAHTILWIKGAPKLGVDSDEQILAFIDKYIHCDIPEDERLAELVCKVQKHRHSVTCRRHGHCRFHFPRPPSPVTVVARECNHSVESENLMTSLCAIRTILDDKNTPCDISLSDLLRKAGISLDAYIQALKICSKGNSVVMKRSPSECWINNYNRDVLRAWKGNMDIQFILDPYACVM